MSKKTTTILLWVLAVLLMLMISVYQRMTGPTHPVRGKETIAGNEIAYKFLRSNTESKPLPVSIRALEGVQAALMYRLYKSGDDWTNVKMTRDGDRLSAAIPGQASAMKVEYLVKVKSGTEELILRDGGAAIARFKGAVPAIYLIPHIILMFIGIVFGIRAGLEALRKKGNYKWMILTTLGILIGGGFIFGPIVQKYAFGDLWTGFPFGYDLTDNKVLLIFIFWVAAFFLSRKSRWWVVSAAVLMLIVYLIPHSVLGSELDPKTGKMKNLFGYNQKLE